MMKPDPGIEHLVREDDGTFDIWRLNAAYHAGRTDVHLERIRQLAEQPQGWSIFPWRWRWF